MSKSVFLERDNNLQTLLLMKIGESQFIHEYVKYHAQTMRAINSEFKTNLDSDYFIVKLEDLHTSEKELLDMSTYSLQNLFDSIKTPIEKF